jgi:hypothetical protein
MKSFLTTCVAAAICLVLLSGTSNAQFRTGKSFLGVNLTLATDPLLFGAQFEYALNPNWGIGGLIRYASKSYNSTWSGYDWSYTYIIPQAQGAYHFMPGNEADPYVGARLGYVIISSSGTVYGAAATSDVFLNGIAGVRYFFSPKVSGNGSLEFRLAGTDYWGSSVGLMIGIDFTL